MKMERKRKKDMKEVRTEGVLVKNVAKSEVFKREKDATEDKLTTEDDILLSLYKTAGIHSAFKHDQIEHPDDPDFIIIEKEAERVARKAIMRKKYQDLSAKKNGLTVPTFTGVKFGAKSKAKAEMFKSAAANDDVSAFDSDSDSDSDSDESKADIPKPIEKANSLDLSSSALLAMMKDRNSDMINLTGKAKSKPKPKYPSTFTPSQKRNIRRKNQRKRKRKRKERQMRKKNACMQPDSSQT